METVTVIVLLSAPFVVGLALTLFLRSTSEGGAFLATLVGGGLAACAALLVGFLVSTSWSDNSGEPMFTPRGWAELLVVVGLLLWLLGVGVAAALLAGRAAIRRRRSVVG